MASLGSLGLRSVPRDELYLVEKAKELFPVIRSFVAETDRLAKLPPELYKILDDAGFLRLTLPKSGGGLQVSIATYKEVVAEVGRACGSSGWVLALINGCNWMASTLFPQEVLAPIFASPGGLRCAGVFSAIAPKVQRVEGGIFIEEARWPWNSGCYHANWDLLGVPMLNDAGEVIGEGLALVPMQDVEILNDWNTIAVRGSGSSTVAVKNLFIPDAHIAPFAPALEGQYNSPYLDGETLYRVAFVPMAAALIVFSSIGIGRGALQQYLTKLPTRRIQYTNWTRQAEAPVTHLQLGQASAKMEVADQLITNVCNELELYAAAGLHPDVDIRVRMRRDCAHASREVFEAVNILADGAGASVANATDIFNRFWRDARVANLHGVLCSETSYELSGRLLAGLEPNTYLL